MSRRGWIVWIVVGCVVAAVGGAMAWMDLDSADKIGSVVGAVCGALGLVLSAFGLVKARRQHTEQPAAAQVDPEGSVENALSESAVTGSVVQAGSVDGPVVIGENNIVGDHNQVVSHGGVLVGAGGQVVLPSGEGGNNNTQVNHYGTVQQLHFHAAGTDMPRAVLGAGARAMETAPAPAGLGRLPVDSRLFVGRRDELDRLEIAASGAGRPVVVAVHGLGGVGKSALVAHYTSLNVSRFRPVWWIVADSPTAIDSGLAALASAIAPEAAALSLDQQCELGIRWLEAHQDWLLVLDNLTTPVHADPLLARVRTGTILITSRQATGWRGLRTLTLGVLSSDEAVELLVRLVRADWSDANLDGATALCAELGALPLAVRQAAAYIAQTRITPADYLERLACYPARMFAATAEGGDAERTMARVWHLTLDRLLDTPMAGRLLRQLAWYAPDDIPRHLVDPGDSPEFGEALGRLAAYSMITLTADTITVHRLVQAVSRTSDPEDRHRQPHDIATSVHAATSTLTHALDEYDPQSPASWPRYRILLPHAQALFDHTDPAADTELTCDLLLYVGRFLHNQGAITAAVDLLTRNRDSALRLYGPDDPDTLVTRIDLASAYAASGDLRRAVELHEAAVADCERVLGPDHRDTLASRVNLGHAYLASGFLDRTVPLCESILADGERVFGRDHRSTLIARHNLAHAYLMAGDTSRAIPLHESVLADCERILGEDSPDTLRSRNNLAHAYLAAGDVGRALPLFRSTLAQQERALGDDHPDTLRSRSDLAKAYLAAGDLTRAIRLSEATLTDQERILGGDHPDTLVSCNNLAHAYQTAGDLDRAISLCAATLSDRERVLGPDHPFTLISRTNLALAYLTIGKLERAILLYEAALADKQRVLGADHPDTLRSRNDVANAYQLKGEMARAIPVFEATLADRERVLGHDHPDTLASRANLANAYQAGGNPSRGLSMLETALADRKRVLGADHPDTLRSRADLAVAYCKVPDLARAIPLMQSTLSDRERVLGADHPDTLRSRNGVACAYQLNGEIARAIPIFEATLADRERVLCHDHPDTLRSRVSLAVAYHAGGDPGRAIPLLEAAVADQQRLLNADHPDTLVSRATLAAVHHAVGNLDRAIALCEATLADCERVLGPEHPTTKTVRSNLASFTD